MGTGIAEGADRAMEAARKRDLEPAARGRVGQRRARRDHQRHRRPGSVAGRGQRGVVRSSRKRRDEDANIIFGAVVDPALKGKVKITVIATGFGSQTWLQRRTAPLVADAGATCRQYTTTRECGPTSSATRPPCRRGCRSRGGRRSTLPMAAAGASGAARPERPRRCSGSGSSAATPATIGDGGRRGLRELGREPGDRLIQLDVRRAGVPATSG